MNELYYGDNLDVLPHIADQSVDLVYLDPPFNSNRSYNVIFGRNARAGDGAAAQIQAFDDTWHWTPTTDLQFQEYIAGGLPLAVADSLTAFHTLLGENDAMAYLVNMAPRMVELRRVLKPTGSVYLHCDPTMSHYLKVLLDAVFGAEMFKNEVIWKRTGAHNSAKRWGPLHDVILFYTKSNKYTWNRTFQAYDESYTEGKFVASDERGQYQAVSLTGPGLRNGDSGQEWRGVNPSEKGRHWQPPSMMYDYYEELTGESLADLPMQERLDKADHQGLIYWPPKKDGQPRFKQYLHISPGLAIQDIISDIPAVNAVAIERLGYPTQKPVSLLERIIKASSKEGDVVLDPFCGCGTTIDAAQRLRRRWIGIDVTYIAVDLIEKRLRHTFGPSIAGTYAVLGIPRDIGGAQALFHHSPFDFERWAVSLIGAQPNEKQVGDKGKDGVARFFTDTKGGVGQMIVSVKGGKNVAPAFVQELSGAILRHKAEMGVLITMATPTRGVLEEVNHSGTYQWPANQATFPRIQVLTIDQLLSGQRPRTPPLMLPYIPAARAQQTPAMIQDTLV